MVGRTNNRQRAHLIISQHTDRLDEHGRVYNELFKLRELWSIVVPDELHNRTH
jgi:hypothetical protein